MIKPHLFFRNTSAGPVELKFKSRYRNTAENEENEEPEEINWTPQQSVFRRCRDRLLSDRASRIANRDRTIDVPAYIEYISIRFWDAFNSKDFENSYRRDFGLAPVRYSEFNTVVLFAIVNNDKFDEFISQLEIYINSDDPKTDESLHQNIIFIKEFNFLTTSKIKQFEELLEYLRLNIIDDIPDIIEGLNSIAASLKSFLEEKSIQYSFNENQKLFEIIGISVENLETIINNFDIFHSVNSPRSGIIAPSGFNLPERSYGFTVSNPDDDLPVIGIIDTGINGESPIGSLIVNSDESFDLTNTSVRIDNANHGTGAAAFAALGNKLIIDESSTEIPADAKLLSIKISDNTTDQQIKESDVISLIRKAHEENGVRIFVLNMSYKHAKEINSPVSNYAYNLDLLSHELDILIFISSGNFDDINIFNPDPMNSNILEYPNQFLSEQTTINEPADSFNNISVGASASNYETFDYGNNHAVGEDFPASYSRRFYHDHSHSFFLSRTGNKNYKRINKHLSKPDVTFPGGNYDRNMEFLSTGLNILSNNLANAFFKHIGTSYSAPLLANLAAQIVKKYNQLSMQSVKALIVNSASSPNLDSANGNNLPFKILFLNGKGNPDPLKSINSDDKFVTMILEDSINPKEIKSYSINLPEYLTSSGKKIGLLKISATLCFSFRPVYSNHLAYCPMDISFGIFKNLELDTYDEYGKATGLNKNSAALIKFRNSWSQDYYYRELILSNCQKMEFNVKKENLISEDNTFKLAIKSQLHKLLPLHLCNEYNTSRNFSLVITIQDNSGMDNSLYDEMIAINELTAVTEIEAEIELEN